MPDPKKTFSVEQAMKNIAAFTAELAALNTCAETEPETKQINRRTGMTESSFARIGRR